MKLSININHIIVVCIVILTFGSCYEPKVGCLDINAKNFDVSADNSCCEEEDCCCEYPNLILDFSFPLYPDTNLVFQMGKPYSLDNTHFFKVDSIAFYLSDIYLINEKGERFTVLDSVLVLHKNDTSYIQDNLTLIKRTQFEYKIGEFPYVDNFVGLECKLGLINAANFISQDTLPSNHPLNNSKDNLYISQDEGFHFFKMVYQKDTLPTSVTQHIFIDETLDLKFSFNKPLIFDRGDDILVNFGLYLLNIFDNVDFGIDSDAIINEKIKQNLPKWIIVDS